MKTALMAAAPLGVVLAWLAALAMDPGRLGPSAVVLVATGSVALASVSTVGMVVNRSRWARRTGWLPVLIGGGLALSRDLDPAWIVAVAVTFAAAVTLGGRGLDPLVRRLPAAAGPPSRAVVVPLLLLTTPALLGLAGGRAAGAPTVMVGLTSLAVAIWFARALPGAVITVRYLWPLLALTLTPAQPLLPAVLSAVAAAAVATTSWHPSVKAAVHPPYQRGKAIPIPPELTPPNVLDAAEVDERGRPR